MTMTREEAIKKLHWFALDNRDKLIIDMAIEALSQPIVAKHFDIQSGYIYCSPQIAENVKVVVWCKDCKHWHSNTEFCSIWSFHFQNVAQRTLSYDYCSRGERKEGGEE